MPITIYDGLLEAAAGEECRAWIAKLIDADDEIVAFVDARLNGGGSAKYEGFVKGSFNIGYCIGFGGRRPSVVIRFAMPGESVTQWRYEKTANEVQAIEYLRETTTIPLPRIHCWGPAEESPRGLGPFMVMDYMGGVRLSTFIRQPCDDKYEPAILNPAVDDAVLDNIFEQIAGFLLQISQLCFHRIGAISKEKEGSWAVTGRPLTFDMNILGTVTGYPVDEFHASSPLDSSKDFFESTARQHLLHLETQRNVADDEADVQRRFVARQRFKQLIPQYCSDDTEPFRIFCDDMQPANMLIDPDTLRITGVLDFEFTNAMPAQFAYDPPWWLVLKNPGLWVEEDGMDDFLARYTPMLDQFLRALERVEAKQTGPALNPPLSVRMRDSWESRRFWFNYASRRCLDIDAVYWAALHDAEDDGSGGLSLLDADTRELFPALVRKKMEQLSAYKTAYAARFPKKGEEEEEEEEEEEDDGQ
jgi:hypothetical protein